MMLGKKALLAALLLQRQAVHAQYEEISSGFNSTFSLSSSQITALDLTAEEASNLNIVARHEESQRANGGAIQDAFYQLPPLTNTSGPLEPGQLLKVQEFTDASNFSLPANTALSRFMYTTTNANGTLVPATGFVLWPYQPRKFQNISHPNTSGKAPAVLWTHGTSGVSAEAAPSASRALWYGVDTVFPLVQEGYAVVAPDYAGLGVQRSWDGSVIPHQYGHTGALARGSLHAMQAALQAFPDTLDERYVVMGHSQGGGVAWAVAEVLAAEEESFGAVAGGYLGTIPASPFVKIFNSPGPSILMLIALGLNSIFPTFQLSDWFTDVGVTRALFVKNELGGMATPAGTLFTNTSQVLTSGVNDTWYAEALGQLGNPGHRAFKGPMLVAHGTADPFVKYELVRETVQEACKISPESDMEFYVASGVGHVPLLGATRHVWMKWIEERFEGKSLKQQGCSTTFVDAWLPTDRYIFSGGSFPQWVGSEAKYAYAALMNN